MNDILSWFGMKRLPFDKSIKACDVLDTEPLQECTARLDHIKQRGGIMLLTGDPGVGKTIALRRFVDGLNDNLYRTFYTPLSTLSRADLLCHINRLIGLGHRVSKSCCLPADPKGIHRVQRTDRQDHFPDHRRSPSASERTPGGTQTSDQFQDGFL